MKVLRNLVMMTAVLSLTACSNDENEALDGPVAAKITASIGGEVKTRAIDQNWTATDAIGVRAVSVSGTTTGVTSEMVDKYKNVKYTNGNAGTSGTFTSDDGIWFEDAQETVTFAAYYPYQESSAKNVLPGTDGVVTGGNTSSLNDTQVNQEKVDFLFATGATASKSASTVQFSDANQFQHKMARIILNVKLGDGFTSKEPSQISALTLGGLIHEGTFNVTTGEAKASNTATAISDWSILNNYKTTPTDTYSYSMIVYPQTLSSALIFTAVVNSQNYVNSISIKPALAAGNSYEYTITINKTGLVVSGCTIADWNKQTEQTGSATM